MKWTKKISSFPRTGDWRIKKVFCLFPRNISPACVYGCGMTRGVACRNKWYKNDRYRLKDGTVPIDYAWLESIYVFQVSVGNHEWVWQGLATKEKYDTFRKLKKPHLRPEECAWFFKHEDHETGEDKSIDRFFIDRFFIDRLDACCGAD